MQTCCTSCCFLLVPVHTKNKKHDTFHRAGVDHTPRLIFPHFLHEQAPDNSGEKNGFKQAETSSRTGLSGASF